MLPDPAALPPVKTVDRAAVLAAVAQAASAYAAGKDDRAEQRSLDGRQFQFRIRFGCDGPSADLASEVFGWSWDAEDGTLRVAARPTLDAQDSIVKALAADRFEAVEGFWIVRPWLLQAVCPAPRVETEPVATASAVTATQDQSPLAARVGLAHFFLETDTRTGRRSMRPYQAVKALESAQRIGTQGFDLVLSGRLKALPDGRVIVCHAQTPDRAPDCIVSSDFDRVRIEMPISREIIAEWRIA